MSRPIDIGRTRVIARNMKCRNQILRTQSSADVLTVCGISGVAGASGCATGINGLFSVFPNAVNIVAGRLAFEHVDVVIETLFEIFRPGRTAAGEVGGYISVADAG